MDDRIKELIDKIKKLDAELTEELQKKQREFYYEILKKRIRFEREIKQKHKLLMTKLAQYINEADILHIITAPVIWSVLLPLAFIDLFINIYQFICFPVYGIPRVRRSNYIIIDHHYLSYLNIIEKINCAYCSYANGLVAFVQEVLARTEQYWCPIKHARRLRTLHSRYDKFMDYGDAEKYRNDFKKVRGEFKDLNKPAPPPECDGPEQ